MSDEEQRNENAAPVATEAAPEPTSPAEEASALASRVAASPVAAGAHDDAPAAHPAQAHGGHGHADHFAHVLPMSLLVGVLVALIVLTVLTVGVTAVDLGSQGNFIVAMIIATIKAVLVMGIFMHMAWDSKFNVVAFASSFLFVLLFLSMSVLDRFEYSNQVEAWEIDQKINAMQ
jgi:cytochrome c oxidase subunit 4